MGKMKYFLMHPPRWLERLLSRIPQYRGWYIKNVCHILHNDVLKSINSDVHLIAFADLKQTLDDMKQEADKLLNVTKKLKEVVSKSWIR